MAIRFARRWGVALLVAAVPLAGVVPAGADETAPAPAGTITATHFYGERVEYPMLFPVAGRTSSSPTTSTSASVLAARAAAASMKASM